MIGFFLKALLKSLDTLADDGNVRVLALFDNEEVHLMYMYSIHFGYYTCSLCTHLVVCICLMWSHPWCVHVHVHVGGVSQCSRSRLILPGVCSEEDMCRYTVCAVHSSTGKVLCIGLGPPCIKEVVHT